MDVFNKSKKLKVDKAILKNQQVKWVMNDTALQRNIRQIR